MDDLALAVLIVASFAVLGASIVLAGRADRRAQRAWAEHLAHIGSRCPACQPFGGWFLGAMKPDGGYEIVECPVCHGSGTTESEEDHHG